jgi:hypothetical protein
MSAKSELDVLANFILAEVPGEPSRSEGAGRTAVRIIRHLTEQVAALEKRLEAAERVCRNALARRRDPAGEVMGRYDDEMDKALDEWAARAEEKDDERN